MKSIALIFLLITSFLHLSAKNETWPVYAFQNGVHFKSAEERVKVLKELGYDGIGSARVRDALPLPQRLKLYDEAGLKLFSFYVGGRLGPKGHSYGKETSQAIKELKGRDTILELFVQGNKKSNTDEQAVAFVREIADQAKVDASFKQDDKYDNAAVASRMSSTINSSLTGILANANMEVIELILADKYSGYAAATLDSVKAALAGDGLEVSDIIVEKVGIVEVFVLFY